MNHPRDDLTAYLDGALPPARADEVRAHLAGCPACREEEARLRSAVALLSSLPPAPELPPFFATRLEARLREERERAPRRRLSAGSPAWAAPVRTGARWRWPAGSGGAGAGGRRPDPLLARDPRHGEGPGPPAGLRDRPRRWAWTSPEDVLIVAQLDELEREEGRP